MYRLVKKIQSDTRAKATSEQNNLKWRKIKQFQPHNGGNNKSRKKRRL